MALIVDQQSNFKHYCKICKKGFGCGRALGGHMRAHGIIGDESAHIDDHDDDDDDDDDQASDWENNVTHSNKRMYSLRANPNRLKSCRVCENCGKEFLSWKSFLEHGKCNSSEDGESLVSSPVLSDGEDGATPRSRRGCGWSKRKRTLRSKVGSFNSNCPFSEEEEDLANCLMMLSNATVDPLDTEPEESCASASKEEEERSRINTIMNFIVPMNHKAKGVANNNNNNKGLFECKACKKVFNSHQALGGHRASHKKVKGCFAARLDHHDDDQDQDQDHDVITHEEFLPTNYKSTATMQFDHGHTTRTSLLAASSSKRKSKVHECSICHRVFSSGQALGGHKRCHWITSSNSHEAKFHSDLKLDLNLPAPDDDDHHHHTGGEGRRGHVSMEVSTDVYLLQPWIGDNHHNQNSKNIISSEKNNCNILIKNNNNVDNEPDSKVKLSKLSELKDMNISGDSSPWLQVGIGSTSDQVGADP